MRNLTYHYKVRRVIGIQNGYQGFIPSYGHDVIELNPETVRDISVDGGTVLGTSRGPQDPEEIVDCLERLNINMLDTARPGARSAGPHGPQRRWRCGAAAGKLRRG
ncbi:MAG: 6-phosphofructokinase [Pseudonocardia sp.]